MYRNRLSARSTRRSPAMLLMALLTVLLMFSAAAPALAQDDSASDDAVSDEVVIFVLDLSGSMNESFDGARTKLAVAKAAFVEAFTNVSPDAHVGLRVYGDQLPTRAPADREQNCTDDSRLVVPIGSLERDRLISEVQAFTALGDTAIALALRNANADIPDGANATIVLFSDGRDECHDADLDGDAASGPSFGEDPCAVARDIAGTGDDHRVDKIVTVGFAADAAAEAELRCIAESTGGSYTAIETPADARDVLPELLETLSSPRVAERLADTPIAGTKKRADAPDLVRLDSPLAGSGRYTDTIEMNSERWYHIAAFGPDAGTFTATVFGLPAEEGISLDMRFFLPESDRSFFEDRGDPDAGLPARPTASIRCSDCLVTGGPHDGYWMVSLSSSDKKLEGTYDLELVTEGPGFGGNATSCHEPRECWYPQEIADRTEAISTAQAQLEDALANVAPADKVAERDELLAAETEAQAALTAAEKRSAELEERLASPPVAATTWRLPLLLALLGIILAFVPVGRFKKEAGDAKPGDVAGEPAPQAPAPPAVPATPEEQMAAVMRPVDPSANVLATSHAAAAAQGASPEAAAEQPAAPVPAAPQAVAQPVAPVAQQPPAPVGRQAVAPMTPEQALAVVDPAPAPVREATPEPAPEPAPEPQAAPAASELPKPGWYEDPLDSTQFRWWGGTKWTEHTSAVGQEVQ